MSQDEDINDDLEQIHKTNSILNNLQVKLNQYMSKSRIVTQRAPTTMTFVMPNIDFKTTNRSIQTSNQKNESSRIQKYKQQKPIERQRISPQISSSFKNLNLIDDQIRLYKNKLGLVKQQSGDRFQQLYQHKSKRLEDEIEDLTQRKHKIQNDKEILGKQNRRLVQILRQKEKEYTVHYQKQRRQQQKYQDEKKQNIQVKRKKLLVQIEKQKLMGQQLENQRKYLEEQMRLFNQKSIAVIDYETKQTSRSKSKSKIQRKAKSQTSKRYPQTVNRHKNCTIQVSKSKALLKKKH